MSLRSTLRHALWIGGLFVILGGLFGMHGLDNHGGAGMETIAHDILASPAANNAAAGPEATTDAVHEAAAVMTVVTDTSRHAAMEMGAAGMCVAVLVLALLALLLRLHNGHIRPLLCLSVRPAQAQVVRGRDPDPPSLIRLSIQRC